MRTAFGILLFALVYMPIAYTVYEELTGRRSRDWARVARGEVRPSASREPQLAGR